MQLWLLLSSTYTHHFHHKWIRDITSPPSVWLDEPESCARTERLLLTRRVEIPSFASSSPWNPPGTIELRLLFTTISSTNEFWFALHHIVRRRLKSYTLRNSETQPQTYQLPRKFWAISIKWDWTERTMKSMSALSSLSSPSSTVIASSGNTIVRDRKQQHLFHRSPSPSGSNHSSSNASSCSPVTGSSLVAQQSSPSAVEQFDRKGFRNSLRCSCFPIHGSSPHWRGRNHFTRHPWKLWQSECLCFSLSLNSVSLSKLCFSL